MTLQTSMTALSERTAQQLNAGYAAYQAGQISEPVWHATAVNLLLAANIKAIGLADFAAAAYLTVTRREPVPTLGIVLPQNERGRLDDAIITLTDRASPMHDRASEVPGRVERLARAEPLNAAQQTYVTALNRHGVTGYRRGVSPDACEMCATWLYRDGYVWPTSKPFHRHPGCACYPVPVES